MRVGLVADVKNQFIVLFIEDIVERDREFNRPQIGGEMPSGFADVFNQKFPDFFRKLPQFLEGQFLEKFGRFNFRYFHHKILSSK